MYRPVRSPMRASSASIIRAVRGLAVGAGQVDDGVAALRLAEQLDEGRDPVQRRAPAGSPASGRAGPFGLGVGRDGSRCGGLGHRAASLRIGHRGADQQVDHVHDRLVADPLVDPVGHRVGLVGEQVRAGARPRAPARTARPRRRSRRPEPARRRTSAAAPRRSPGPPVPPARRTSRRRCSASGHRRSRSCRPSTAGNSFSASRHRPVDFGP